MGLFDRLAQRMGYAKAPKDAELAKWLMSTADYESMLYPQYVDNRNKLSYFQRVSWVNIAVDKVATIGSGAGWNVKRLEGEDTVDIPNHPFERVMRNPNPTMAQSDLIYATLAYMSVCNTAYWWVNYGLNKEPVELWLIPTKQISPIPDGRMYLKGYDYDPGDGGLIRLDTNEVIAFNGFNPDSMFTGMSNLDPLTTVMDSDIGMQNWNKKLFTKSNGRLPGILAFADPIPDDDWQLIQGDVDKAAAMRNFMMLRNVKAGGVQWIQATATQKDMEFLNSRLANRDEIYSAIAPGLASMLSVNATEANARIGKSTLIDFKVYPMLQKIASVVTTKLMPVYGEGMILEPEDIRVTDRILEMAEMAEYSKTHTVDEVRAKYWQDEPIADVAIGGVLVAAAQSYTAVKVPEETEPSATPIYENGNESIDVTAEFDSVMAKDIRPAMLEIDKWERKQKKAGKAVDFISYNIPMEIVTAIKEGATFDHARDMLKADTAIVVTHNDDEVEKIIKMLELNLASFEVKQPEYKAPITNITLNANMPDPGQPGVTVNVPQQAAPIVNNTVEVNPTPVNVNNQVNPTPVNIENNVTAEPKIVIPDNEKKRLKVTRDNSGKITGMDEM